MITPPDDDYEIRPTADPGYSGPAHEAKNKIPVERVTVGVSLVMADDGVTKIGVVNVEGHLDGGPHETYMLLFDIEQLIGLAGLIDYLRKEGQLA